MPTRLPLRLRPHDDGARWTARRALTIGDQAYTLTLDATGFTLALKGRRIGLTIAWADLVNGEAALATALNASLSANIRAPATVTSARKRKPKQ